MSKTIFNFISDDWKRIKNHCRTTDNKDFTEKDATNTFKKNLLISEHSPIRLLEFDWSWKKIMYWVSTEWSRHKFEKFISTARDDRGFADKHSETEYKVWDNKTNSYIKYFPNTRNDAPQKNPVNFDGYANMQNLIDAWRKRLCFCATKDARELAEDFKSTLHETHPIESDVLVPNCIYRCGCCEKFQQCTFFGKFLNWIKYNYPEKQLTALFDIQTRYDLYNEYFYSMRKEDEKC